MISDINNKYKYITILGSGVFVALFLGIFRPFDTVVSSVWNLVNYGLITIGSCVFYFVVLPKLLGFPFEFGDKYTFKHFIFDIGNIITIGTCNFFYSSTIEGCSVLNWEWFWKYQFYTFTIGGIVSLILYFFGKNIILKNQLKEIETLNASLHNQLKEASINKTFVFESETRNEKLVLQSDDLICIKAEGNYSSFYYSTGDKVTSKLLRLSLKNTESIIETSSNFSRSHRSYIVNINKIIKIDAVGSSYQIWVNGLLEPLPASRQNIADLKASII